ncbi:hypothetical protein [Thiobacillus sp.]
MASPAMVPSTVAAALATRAISTELRAANSMSASPNSSVYHLKVNPTHSAFSRESLKE